MNKTLGPEVEKKQNTECQFYLASEHGSFIAQEALIQESLAVFFIPGRYRQPKLLWMPWSGYDEVDSSKYCIACAALYCMYCIVRHCTMYCIVLHLLHCTALYCMYCIVLHVLYCKALYCLYCIVLHVLHCTACIALYCTVLHVLHCTALYPQQWNRIHTHGEMF